MASQGPNSAGTGADDSSVGTKTWTDTTLIYTANALDTSEANVARVQHNTSGYTYSYFLKATNFGFTIPSGATINGVVVEIRKRIWNQSNVYDETVKLVVGGVVSGTNKSVGANVQNMLSYSSYGGSSDAWGATLTDSVINASNFGVVFQTKGNNYGKGYSQCNVDHIRITVYYTAGGGGAIDLVPNSNIHSHLSDNVVLTQTHVISINSNVHGHLADNIALTQVHNLVINGNIHAHLSDNTTVSQIHNISVNDNVHSHASGNVGISQVHNISVQENVHSHLSDSAIVATQVHNVSIAINLHSHLSDNVNITQSHILSVDANLHTHLSDNVAITGIHVLAVNANIHAHISDNVVFTQAHNLSVGENIHGHSSDNVILTQIHVLSVNENVHSHISDSLTLSTYRILKIDGTLLPILKIQM
jgi:hypothetical protein